MRNAEPCVDCWASAPRFEPIASDLHLLVAASGKSTPHASRNLNASNSFQVCWNNTQQILLRLQLLSVRALLSNGWGGRCACDVTHLQQHSAAYKRSLRLGSCSPRRADASLDRLLRAPASRLTSFSVLSISRILVFFNLQYGKSRLRCYLSCDHYNVIGVAEFNVPIYVQVLHVNAFRLVFCCLTIHVP